MIQNQWALPGRFQALQEPAKIPFHGMFLLCLLLLLSGACSDRDASIPGSNLLLITLDTTRADALSCYGGPDGITPNLDDLADEGVRFEQARSVTPVTLPSHASVLTGQYPFEHGVRDNATFRLPDRITTLAERMKREGYATCAVMGAFVLHSTFGLDQGFDIYSDVPQRGLNLGIGEDQRTAREVVDEALRILDSADRDKPLFLWVHFFDPHFPYRPPEEYSAQKFKKVSGVSLPGREKKNADYLGEVAYMDHELGRLMEGMEDRLPGARLLTAVVADHGEGLGDHGEDSHGFQLYDTTMRVPMILHHPGLPQGMVISEEVSVADLAPTVTSLLGLEFEEATGVDLAPLMGLGQDRADSSLAYLETAHPFYNHGWSPLFSITDGTYKLIEGPGPELYNLKADPEEATNLVLDHSDKAAALRAMMKPLVSRTRKSVRIELTKEDQERIAALGYAGSARGMGREMPMVPGRISEGLRDPGQGLDIWERCSRARSLAAGKSERDRQEAVELITEVLNEDPGNPTFLAHAGTIYFQAKLYRQAIYVLEQSIKQLESATTREVLATCHFNSGNLAEAIALLKINAELHPFDLISRYKLGDALLRQGHAREALEHLDFFLEKHGTRDDLHTQVESLKHQAEKAVQE